MNIEPKPLIDITQEALKILFQRLGTVNTIRFLSQFTVGYGDYVEEREVLFGHLTLDEILNDIKQQHMIAELSPEPRLMFNLLPLIK